MFSTADSSIIERNYCKTVITKTTVDHLKALETEFCKHFISNIDFEKGAWIQTLFISNIDFKKGAWIQSLFWIGLSEIDHLPLKPQDLYIYMW
jgi:hypothetical protein